MLTYAHAGFRYEDPGSAVPHETRPAVRDVTLDVPASAFVLLAGGSGSGKSTLVRMANGLIPQFHAGEFRGAVRVNGADTRHCLVRDLAAHVGVVFQNQEAQLFNATVERELAFGPRNAGLPPDEIAARVAWAAAHMGIAHLMQRPTHHLSGGEAARVAIAAVLTMQPSLLMLDEPTAALDPVAVASLWNLLRDLNRNGTGIVIAEHRADEAWESVESVAVMRNGALAFQGGRADALVAPLTPRDLTLPRVTQLFVDAGLPERPRTLADATAVMRSQRFTLLPMPREQPGKGEVLLHADCITFERDHRTILDGITLQLSRGESVALVGANGAGKTTLLRLLAGLTAPRRGRIVGADTRPFARARIGLLLQNADHALFCPTVREEVAYSARALARYDAAWLHELHARFDLESLLDRAPLSLSDGEKRRVAFAAMLAHRPDVVLLDEPTAGQDAVRKETLRATIAMLRAHGAALLLVTHDLTFAAENSERWLVLADGRLIADAPPDTVLGDAALLARARLLPTPIARLAAALGIPYPGERVVLAGNAPLPQAT